MMMLEDRLPVPADFWRHLRALHAKARARANLVSEIGSLSSYTRPG
jgi:hypothetical protein